MKISIEEIIKATNAEILKNEAEQEFLTEISTDTRTIKFGDFYLPLKGEKFDGENFLEKAVGAIGCLVTQNQYPEFMKTVLKVNDTLNAYLKIAQFIRKKIDPKVVHITGSSGKTTTKEMVYAVLSRKFKTVKTFSNHNNEIGFCQTVLSMPPDCEALVIETGMRGLGEIELISRYLNPDIAIITNAGSAHIGRLGSLDNIAIAKCEIASNLKSDGFLIANDNERIKKFNQFTGDKIFYSVKDARIIEMAIKYTKFEYKGNIYELNTDGEYNIENSIAAIEAGLRLNLTPEEIKNGLRSYHPIEKRWEEEFAGGYRIINDSYNANPDSMKAAVKTFLQLYKNPLVVLGNMGELGENEKDLHRDVGKFIAKLNLADAKFIFVGDLSVYIADELEKNGVEVKIFKNTDKASRYIIENINSDTTILLKASRSMKFEDIIENLRKEGQL